MERYWAYVGACHSNRELTINADGWVYRLRVLTKTLCLDQVKGAGMDQG